MRYSYYLKAVFGTFLIAALSGCLPESEETDSSGDENNNNSSEIIFPDSVDMIPNVNGILIDGLVDDWAGVSPILMDQSGDGGNYDGMDVTAIYLAQDSSYLFMRVQMAGATRPPTNEYHNYWIYFESNDFEFAIEAFHDPSIDARLWDITGADRNYYQQTQLGSMPSKSSGDVIEVRIPKNMISVSTNYRVDFFTHYTVNLEWANNGDNEAETPGYISFF